MRQERGSMRSLRLLTLVGFSMGACALAAPVAAACVLDTFGPAGSGGSVRPGDPVDFTIRTISTPDSPNSSPYVIDAGGVPVASGTATPDAGGEWTGTGSFQMPPLGEYAGPVTITISLSDSPSGPQSFPVQYDGTSAPAGPKSSTPATTGAPGPAPATQVPPPAKSVPPVTPARPRHQRQHARQMR